MAIFDNTKFLEGINNPMPQTPNQPLFDQNKDYSAEIAKIQAVNPNDPQIRVLNQQRDEKIKSMYGNNYMAEIEKRQLKNPNDPMIADLTRLRNVKVAETQPIPSGLPAVNPEAARQVMVQSANQPPMTQEVPTTMVAGQPIQPPTQDEIINNAPQGTYVPETWKEASKETGFDPLQEYKAQNRDKIMQMVSDIKPFAYDPNADPALKLAQQQASQSIMEIMNSRGILNSTVTADRASQAIASLVPEYANMAFQQYKDKVNMVYQNADFLNSLDQQDLELFKNRYENFFNLVSAIDSEKEKNLKAKEAEVKNAMDIVDMIGYVDNEASLILGLPVGTLSKSARETADKFLNDIAMENQKLQNSKKLKEYEKEIDLDKFKQQEEFKKQEKKAEETKKSNYARMKASIINMNADEALQLVQKNSTKLIESLGGTLYDQLIQDIATKKAKENEDKKAAEAAKKEEGRYQDKKKLDERKITLDETKEKNRTNEAATNANLRQQDINIRKSNQSKSSSDKNSANNEKTITQKTKEYDDVISKYYVTTDISGRKVLDKDGIRQYLLELSRNVPEDQQDIYDKVYDNITMKYGIYLGEEYRQPTTGQISNAETTMKNQSASDFFGGFR